MEELMEKYPCEGCENEGLCDEWEKETCCEICAWKGRKFCGIFCDYEGWIVKVREQK